MNAARAFGVLRREKNTRHWRAGMRKPKSFLSRCRTHSGSAAEPLLAARRADGLPLPRAAVIRAGRLPGPAQFRRPASSPGPGRAAAPRENDGERRRGRRLGREAGGGPLQEAPGPRRGHVRSGFQGHGHKGSASLPLS
jgi:hypothetical protein